MAHMLSHSLRAGLCLLISVAAVRAQTQPAGPATTPALEERLGPGPPRLERIDRADLTHFVRRLLLRKLRDSEDYQATFVPESLQAMECRASVTLRDQGRILGTADSDSLPVMEAVGQAARMALEKAAGKPALAEEHLGQLGLEIELAGPREPIGHAGEPAARLITHLEPAIHGIGFEVDGREVLVRPSQLISMEVFCHEEGDLGHQCDRYRLAIESFQDKSGLRRDPPDRDPERVLVHRFRTDHWYQPRADVEPVELVAGLRLIAPEEAQTDALPPVLDLLGRYLAHRQNQNGFFSYEYLPGRGVYWTADENWVRQAGTTWTLAQYAGARRDSELIERSARAIAAWKQMARPLAADPRATYLHTPDNTHPLGAAALVSLAIMDSPQAELHADLLAGLMAGIESLQQPDGHFRTHFPPSRRTTSQDYFPGEALLAMARYHELRPEARRREAFDRALPYYTSYFRETRVPAFIPWQAQAFGRMARTTRLQKYADFVFEMTDYLLTLQLDVRAMPLAIYDGAIDTTAAGRGGVSSAVYLEGLADAIRTADTLNDRPRAERYRGAARRMARFVVQLCFRDEEAYYVHSPREVIGGVRNTPADPTLRIDHVQHALSGLMGAAEVLTPATRPPGELRSGR